MSNTNILIGSLLCLMLLASGVFAEYTDAEQEYVKGNGFFLLGEIAMAEQAYENATSLDPTLAVAWNNLGITRKKMGNLTESAAAYEMALNLTPDDDSVWYNYGLVLDSLERYDESLVAYQRAVTINPNMTPAWFNLTASLARAGESKQADEAYAKASALDPQYAANWSYPVSHEKIPVSVNNTDEKGDNVKSPFSFLGSLFS